LGAVASGPLPRASGAKTAVALYNFTGDASKVLMFGNGPQGELLSAWHDVKLLLGAGADQSCEGHGGGGTSGPWERLVHRGGRGCHGMSTALFLSCVEVISCKEQQTS
jgi:hypothetical protein